MSIPLRTPWLRPAGLAALTAGLVLAALALPAPAHADPATEVTWSVQPSTPEGPDGRTEFDYAVAPGSTVSDWVSVSNYSSAPATFRVYGADATTDYTTGSFTLVGADQASTDAGAWTSVNSGPASCPDTNDAAEAQCTSGLGVSITLEPGTRADLPFTLTVPHDATPGDHAAGIVASFQSTATDSTGSAVNVAQRVGTRIYLRVDGALAPSVGISGLVSGFDGTVDPVGTGTGTVGFDLTNTGNVRLSAAPSVHLTGPFGIDFGSASTPPVSNLVPGGTTHVTAAFPGVPPLFLLFSEVTVTPGPGDGAAQGDALAAPVTASATAWAVPWSLLVLVLLVVAIVWGALWWRRRSRQRLADDLADYAEQIRAETLGEPAGDDERDGPAGPRTLTGSGAGR